jgi:hypothetical protein
MSRMINLMTAALLAFAQEKAEAIEWVKDLETAMAQSAKDGRPVITYWTFDT